MPTLFISVPLVVKTIFFFKVTARKSEARVASCGSDDTYNNLSGWNGTGSFEARWREMACFPGGF